MRALITGGNGFVGRWLRQCLLREGIEVATLGTSLHPDVAGFKIKCVQDSLAIFEAVKNFHPDFLFHLAGTAVANTSNEFSDVNLGYCARLLDAIDCAGLAKTTRLLVIGSAAEYGIVQPADMPIPESLPPRPTTLYGKTKLAQTNLALQWSKDHGAFVTVVRPFNLIGPGMPQTLAIGSFIAQLLTIRGGGCAPVLEVGDLTNSRDFLDIGCAVDLLWRLVRCDRAGGAVVNLCSGVPVAIEEILDYAIRVSGAKVEIKETSERLRKRDMKVHYGDNSLLRGLLGHTPQALWQKSVNDMLSAGDTC